MDNDSNIILSFLANQISVDISGEWMTVNDFYALPTPAQPQPPWLNANYLEQKHDFIQLILPNKSASAFIANAQAYTVSQSTLDYWMQYQSDVILTTVVRNLLQGVLTMLNFWGFRVQSWIPYELVPHDKIVQRMNNMIVHTHNFKRFSRLLHALRLFGLHTMAQQTFNIVTAQLQYYDKRGVSNSAIQIWSNILKDKSYQLSKSGTLRVYAAMDDILSALQTVHTPTINQYSWLEIQQSLLTLSNQ